MYSAADVLPVVRSNAERLDPHPLFGEFMKLRVSRAFSRDEVRTAVIPAYMGLIKQIDDAIGVLIEGMRRRGLLDSTMIALFGPRRLSRRSLAGREGFLSRAGGKNSADRR